MRNPDRWIKNPDWKPNSWTTAASVRRWEGKPAIERVRFTLRLLPNVYNKCTHLAKKDGLALNDWIAKKLEEIK